MNCTQCKWGAYLQFSTNDPVQPNRFIHANHPLRFLFINSTFDGELQKREHSIATSLIAKHQTFNKKKYHCESECMQKEPKHQQHLTFFRSVYKIFDGRMFLRRLHFDLVHITQHQIYVHMPNVLFRLFFGCSIIFLVGAHFR